jgi:DNA-binding ferritin-like protein
MPEELDELELEGAEEEADPDEEAQEEAPSNTVDPYSGLHAESIYALWHDPTTYDHMSMGPPYLPEPKVRLARSSKAEIKSLVEKVANASPIEQMFLTLLGDYQNIAMAELGVLVASMRAAAMVHQSHHWQTRGDTFYGDHLLYERLYNDSLDLIDRVAERAVGAGHRLLVHPVVQASQVGALVKFFSGDIQTDPGPDQYAVTSFLTELYLLSILGLAYKSLEATAMLSNGTDNLLQDVADKHEEFVYLLRQRAQTKVGYDRRK